MPLLHHRSRRSGGGTLPDLDVLMAEAAILNDTALGYPYPR